jgi:hypothetical protein
VRVTQIGQGLCVVAVAVWLSTRNHAASPAAAATTAASNQGAAPPAASSPAQKPEQISAARVAAEFANNEAAAEDRFHGRCLVLTGSVELVDAGIGKDPSLHLSGGIMGVLVSDVPREFAKTLNRGDSVILDVSGLDEILGQPAAQFSADCQRQRLAFEAAKAAEAEAKRSAQKASKSPQSKGKAGGKPASRAGASGQSTKVASGQ